VGVGSVGMQVRVEWSGEGLPSVESLEQCDDGVLPVSCTSPCRQIGCSTTHVSYVFLERGHGYAYWHFDIFEERLRLEKVRVFGDGCVSGVASEGR
jgi:hypothetical protein